MRKLCLVLIVAMMVGCEDDSAGDSKNIAAPYVPPAAVDCKEGVYYFPNSPKEFQYCLPAFLAEHKDLEVAAMCGTGNYPISYNDGVNGYFVVFRKRQLPTESPK